MIEQPTAQLRINGCEDREIIHVQYQFCQQIDIEGQPTGTACRGIIHLKVRSIDSGTIDLLGWACNTHNSKNGTISLPNKKGGYLKVISFTDAYCIGYEEVYDDSDANHMFENITIASRLLIVTGKSYVEYDNHWAL